MVEPEERLTLADLLKEFYLYLRMQNQTESGMKTSRWHLERFFKYLQCKGISRSYQLTPEILRDYQLGMVLGETTRGKRYSPTTVNRYMSSVKSFVKFLKKRDQLSLGPEDGITYARSGRRLPRGILSAEEMVRLIEMPDIRKILGYRDRTIMEVLYSTAIRRNECRFLKVSDVDFSERTLRVSGKGQKERYVPVGRIALKFLEGYVSHVRPLLVKGISEEHLFLSVKGRYLSVNVMGEFIAKYAKLAGISKRVTPHTFRHTCATLMLRNEADIRHIQELLGHESLETTQIYTHVTLTDLRRVLAKYHPRERA
ncbi:MAG: hypothetical protein DSY80_09310 [Desulfocapsa sp.]|nr:MAG: hypothetical protein DSY80_09310 [Desulfocapsa sp.]